MLLLPRMVVSVFILPAAPSDEDEDDVGKGEGEDDAFIAFAVEKADVISAVNLDDDGG